MNLPLGFDDDLLTALAEEAVSLLCRGEIAELADRYGYAFAGAAEPEAAIREDLDRCLSEVGATSLRDSPGQRVGEVTHFEPNRTKLIGVIQYRVSANNGASLLVDLLVARDGDEHYLKLEEIRSAE